jgi:hypothetical protein
MKRILLIGIALALLGLACGEEVYIEPEGAGSPAEALEVIEVAFNERAMKVLASALSESFVFFFDPDDVGQNPPGGSGYVIPESWFFDDFWPAANNLLKKAYSVYISVPSGRIRTPGENEAIFVAEDVNICVIVMTDEINGYIVDRGHCDFEFEKYPSKSGGYYWHVTMWWDNTEPSYDANPGLAPTSLGKLLAIYYCQP